MALYTIGKPAILRALDKIEDRLAFEGNKYIPYPKNKGFPDWVLATDGMDNVFWKKDETGGGGGGGGSPQDNDLFLIIDFIPESTESNVTIGTTSTSLDNIADALQKGKLLFLQSEDDGMFGTFKGSNINELEFFGTTYTYNSFELSTVKHLAFKFELDGLVVVIKRIQKIIEFV